MNPLSSQATRAGGIGVAVFGVAFLVLQALQQAVGAFNPRADIVVAIIVAVSAGTLTLDRLRTRSSEKAAAREQQETLEAAMVNWKPRPFRQIPPEDLGVFPGRDGHGERLGADAGDDWRGYVERDVDPRLREALKSAPFVLVFGDARAGKTRTTAQVARQVLGDALVLIPRSADGLEKFFEVKPLVDSRRVVLWLDGLERFAKVIDAETLDRLAGTHASDPDDATSGPSITVVATIREGTWDRLLNADGQEGEFGKAVAARARAFRVPTTLDSGKEQSAAHELYPEVELAEGMGAALAASGKDERAREGWPAKSPEVDTGDESTPPKEEEVRDSVARVGRRLQESGDPWALLPAGAWLLAVIWVAGSAAINGGISKERQPTIGEQVAAIRSEGSEGSRVSEKPNKVDFHGSELPSYVFSFREADRSSGADEIQVWDVIGGDELKERFSFQPDRPAVFQYRAAADIDGDGDEELIAGYGPTVHSGELLVPFALVWNDDAGGYQIVNLHPSAPDLDVQMSQRIRTVTAPYREPTTYADGDGQAVSGYPSQDFAVLPSAQRLVSGYIIRTSGTAPAALDVEVESFDTQAGSPHLRDCNFPNDKPVLALDDPGALLFNVLDERWAAVSAHKRCAPVL